MYQSRIILLFAALALLAGILEGQPQIAVADEAAVVNGKVIRLSQVDDRLGVRLLRAKTDEYTLRMVALNEIIDQFLLAREAEKRHLTVPDLLKREVTDRASTTRGTLAPSAASSFESNPILAPEGDVTSVAALDAMSRRFARLRSDFLASLRAEGSIQIRLEQPRLRSPISGGRNVGPSSAAVQITLFTDFQCPYCNSLNATLRRLRADYPAEVRITVKQLPIPSHPQSFKAAEAALCADEQGRYLQMHERMFSGSAQVAAEQFGELATESGLSTVQFQQCLNSHGFEAEVEADIADARSLGINSTPTMFINGLMVVGNKPYDAIRAVIASEMTRGAK